MHTLKVILAGLAVLAACMVSGYLLQGGAALAPAALVFIPLWLLASAGNLWVGVKRAGYTVREEFPVLLAVFTVPAAIALAVWWRLAG